MTAREDSKVLTFKAGSGRFGIPLEWVCAVREEGDQEDSGTKVVFRERELPLVDLIEWFGGAARRGRYLSLLVVGKGAAVAALRVDSPGRVVSGGRIRSWPSLCSSMVQGVFSGVIEEKDDLILVIDPEGICSAFSSEVHDRSQGGARR